MEQNDLIIGLIYLMVEEENPFLINLLQRSGSFVTNQSSPDEVLDASLKALKDSSSFRQNLYNYLVSEANSYSNYVEDDFFNFGALSSINRLAQTTAPQTTAAKPTSARQPRQKPAKFDPKTGTGGSRVGGVLRSVFSNENIGLLVSAGIGAASTKLQDSASSKGDQRALDFKNAEIAAEELKQKSASISNESDKPKPKWVLPVAIGGGLLVVGLIVFFAIKKK
jgi:hypothetical protein